VSVTFIQYKKVTEPQWECLKNAAAVFTTNGLDLFQEHHWHQWANFMLRLIFNKPTVYRQWEFPNNIGLIF